MSLFHHKCWFHAQSQMKVAMVDMPTKPGCSWKSMGLLLWNAIHTLAAMVQMDNAFILAQILATLGPNITQPQHHH